MISTAAPSEEAHRPHLRRAVVAATVGTAIEWYDFILYSTVTGLVFAKLYFPHADPLVGTLEAFGIYAVGFLARPIGAAILGHYGDRMGRKSALIATGLLRRLSRHGCTQSTPRTQRSHRYGFSAGSAASA